MMIHDAKSSDLFADKTPRSKCANHYFEGALKYYYTVCEVSLEVSLCCIHQLHAPKLARAYLWSTRDFRRAAAAWIRARMCRRVSPGTPLLLTNQRSQHLLHKRTVVTETTNHRTAHKGGKSRVVWFCKR